MLIVELNIKLALDDEEARLFALYDLSSAKEMEVSCQLLYPVRNLPHETYIKLIETLRIIRTECNDNRLAIGVRRKQRLELLTAHC
jgi:hypothetical protein